MNFLSQFVPSESLMRWREPNAYVRKDLSHGGWIGLLIVFMIAPALLIASHPDHHFSKKQIIVICVFTVFGLFAFICIWLGSGDPVCLKEDHLTKSTGNSRKRSLYKNIECYSVCHNSYNDTKFSVLKFTTKKGLPVGQIAEVAVPGDVNLERVLQILRDKGVTVITEPS
jgi:hypothetical protein